MQHLIVAVDGSEGGRAAVAEAVALASDLGAHLTFVYVRKPPSAVFGDPYYEHLVGTALAKARETIADALIRAGAAGIEADGEILEGDPADEIVSLADNRDADLIVVGSRGRGPLAGALLGSVSSGVAQHASAPVLVAKQPHVRQRQVA